MFPPRQGFAVKKGAATKLVALPFKDNEILLLPLYIQQSQSILWKPLSDFTCHKHVGYVENSGDVQHQSNPGIRTSRHTLNKPSILAFNFFHANKENIFR